MKSRRFVITVTVALLAHVIASASSANIGATCGMNILNDTRVDGNDLGNATVSTAGDCCAACTNTIGCNFFTFVASKNLCWLKMSGSGEHRNDPDCTSGGVPASQNCTSSPGACNGAGICVTGVCQCDSGFSGTSCETLSLQNPYSCADGGLCVNDTSTWGGSVVLGDDGKYHMFAAMFSNNCPLGSWLTNSRVAHAVSSTPQGPYYFSEYALGPRDISFWDGLTQHNPEIARAPDGTYLLFYMGSTANTTHQNCSKGEIAGSESEFNQRVGLATARSPYGPWTRPDAPTILPGKPGTWDDLFTTNPAVHIYSNGTILMVYKGRSSEHSSEMLQGVAIAENYTMPFQKFGGPINVPTDCEDAGMYRAKSGYFHMLNHCGCAGQYLWSPDGLTWHRTTPSQAWCDITYSDGTRETLHRRERPKFVLGANGQPTHLLNGVSPSSSHERRTFTMATPWE